MMLRIAYNSVLLDFVTVVIPIVADPVSICYVKKMFSYFQIWQKIGSFKYFSNRIEQSKVIKTLKLNKIITSPLN